MPKLPGTISSGKLVAEGMLLQGTPIEDHTKQYGLWVKREDLSCPAPGPPFSKTRGVYAHIKNRPEKLIGVLDTAHSQAGHAVARACQILGKECLNFYPVYKKEIDENGEHELRTSQLAAQRLGADVRPLNAGRSCILFHDAKKQTLGQGGYMMPNALKLTESVTETAKEVPKTKFDTVLIPVSSGTIAAGVILGFSLQGIFPKYLMHLGYSRSHSEVVSYLKQQSGCGDKRLDLVIIDEEYNYKDKARPGVTPPWPCNEYYDLKAVRWWMNQDQSQYNKTLLWNIG